MISLLARLPLRKLLGATLILCALSAVFSVSYFGYRYLTNLTKRVSSAEGALQGARSENLRMRRAIMATNQAIQAAAEDAEAWESRYKELSSQPPEEVIIYRERSAEPDPRILQAENCTDALVELSKVLTFPGGDQ